MDSNNHTRADKTSAEGSKKTLLISFTLSFQSSEHTTSAIGNKSAADYMLNEVRLGSNASLLPESPEEPEKSSTETT